MHHINSCPRVATRHLRAPSRPLFLLLAAAAAWSLAGCGQKGPLSLPPASGSASAPAPAR